jgi:ribose transport system permease protein
MLLGERETMTVKRPDTLGEVLRRFNVFLILIGLCVLLSLLSDRFLNLSNLLTVALQTSIVAITAVGMTYSMLTAGIDLSVGSIVALSSALSAGFIVKQGLPIYLAMSLALAAGAGLGAISGLLIVKGRLPPFVATLAMMAVGRGLTLAYTQGWTIPIMLDEFTFWGTGKIGPVPVPVVVLAVVFVAAYVVLSRTKFGLHIYAVGGHQETARLAGINTGLVTIAVYVISGFTAALAGIITAARLWSAQPNVATGLELDAITASVLGGTSLFGGVGGVGGTLVGAFIMGVLNNGLNLLEVSSYYQKVVKGIVFILAVMLDLFTKQRR